MKTGAKGLQLIKEFEGCKLEAYLCPAKVWTIGYGNTFYPNKTSVKKGDVITQERAEELLLDILKRFEIIVMKNIKVAINQNQFDALVSHTYNTGGSKTLFDLVNRKATKEEIYNWFTQKYITGNGVKLSGLVRRREAEANLYFS
jgi:lysozyme